MRLLVNTASALKGGSVQVAASFLRECAELQGHEFGFVLGPSLQSIVRQEEYASNIQFFDLPYRPAQRVRLLRESGSDLGTFESQFCPDVVFTTSGPSYWRPNVPHLMGSNLPHCLYRDSPYFTQKLGSFDRMRWALKARILRYYTKGFADAWVVQTDDVNRRLRNWISETDVVTVPNTVASFYRQPPVGLLQETTRTRDPAEFRVLVLSSYYPHKDLEIVDRIIDLMRAIRIRNVRFTMTLPTTDFAKAVKPRNRDWVTNVGPVPPDQCPRLYAEANAMLMPSLLECFSANYVESMAMRCPIVATNLGFATSTCGDAALYFEPLNAASALERILELRGDKELQRQLINAGERQLTRFGTSRSRAESYLRICQALIDERTNLAGFSAPS